MFNVNPKDRAIFIYNPNSGRMIIEKNIDYIEAQFKNKFNHIDIVKSKSPEHLKEVIVDACTSYDYVFFSGGDGTFNMVMNSIPKDLKNLPVFGYLPGGSTCDMGYNTNISKDPKIGIHDLLNAKIKEYSIGSIGNKRFVYVASTGNILKIQYLTPIEEKKKYGTIAYFKSALKNIPLIRKANNIIIDGVKYKSPLVVVSNSKEIGGFRINRDSEEGRPLYFAAIVKPDILFGTLNLLYVMIHGIYKAYKKKKINLLFRDEFKIDSDSNDWDVDGEPIKVEFPTTVGYSGLNIRLLVNRD